jgi:hypothetical protein
MFVATAGSMTLAIDTGCRPHAYVRTAVDNQRPRPS